MSFNQKSIDAMVRTGFENGCARDQIENFLHYGYIPQPKQLLFHADARACDIPGGPTQIGLGGARGPGKSHAIMAQIGLDDCVRVPGLKFLFLRKIQKAAKESFEDLIARVFFSIRYDWHPSDHRLIFPDTNSRIIIGGFRDEKEIAGYLGLEYDGIAIEEATLISELKFDMVQGSLRTSKPNWRPRMYLSTNPGGVGHAYFRNRFVLPAREHRETDTRFIFSTYKDNKFLNPEYVDYLEKLQGPLGKAWRDGNWDVFEGQAFPTWDYDQHVCEPFEIPQHWFRWRAIDWGYAAPFSCHWYAKDPDTGRIFIYREIYMTQLTVPQQARLILDYTGKEIIGFTFADPAMWARKSVNEIVTTTAQEYQDAGVPLTKADNDRLSGKRKIDQLLANLPDGEPGVKIFSTCPEMIKTLPALTYSKHNPEDVDTELEDHAYDDFRYALTNMRIGSTSYKPQRRKSPIEELYG